jgi:hypothetical protein
MEYNAGVTLYEKYGSSPNQKMMLRRGSASTRNKEILEYELKKLINTPEIHSLPKPIIGKPIIAKIIEPKIIKSVIEPKFEANIHRPLQEDAKVLFEEIKMMLKERDNLHATLEYIPTNDQRLTNALRILEISDSISDAYERLGHYDKHGVLPSKPIRPEPIKRNIEEMDKGDLISRRLTIRTYISKYSRLSEKAKTPEMRAKNLEILEKYKLELEEIEKALKK